MGRKILTLPGPVLSPQVVLHRTLDKLPRIKGVVVVIQWDDDTMDVDWSSLRLSDLCMASKVLDATTARTLMGEGDEA